MSLMPRQQYGIDDDNPIRLDTDISAVILLRCIKEKEGNPMVKVRYKQQQQQQQRSL